MKIKRTNKLKKAHTPQFPLWIIYLHCNPEEKVAFCIVKLFKIFLILIFDPKESNSQGKIAQILI
jgi:hypothetical protein